MFSESNNCLVCGGDSLVGGGLTDALSRTGLHPYTSTRREASAEGRRVHLDLEKPETYQIPKGVDYVFVVAAATNYQRCEVDPTARQINVFWTPQFIRYALKKGVFVTFISTNSVFGGEVPWPHEDAPHTPGIEYARQKHDAENEVLKAAADLDAKNRLNIVRLTKILSPETSPIPNWRNTWLQGGVVEPFSDLIFAPMSVQFVGESLARIGEKRVPGNLHLSGSENVSYVDLAVALAEQWKVDPSLISPTTSSDKGIQIPFKPTFSGIAMTRTQQLCGLSPQTLNSVVKDISNAPLFSSINS